jgi:hypothetical protein
MSKLTKSVKAECGCCRATGLYQGFAEAEGTAVICLNCDGTGCETLTYTEFTKRKSKCGVKTVHRSGGTFIATGVGPVGSAITYAEFKAGKMPNE